MTINARGKGYEAFISHGQKRYRKTFKTHDEAAAWEAKVKLAILEGRDPENIVVQSGDWTLKQGVEACFKAIWGGGKSEKTMAITSGAAISFFGGNVSLSAITTEEIQRWVDYLKSTGNSNATVNRKLAALSRVMSYARQCGKLSALPHFNRQKEPKGRLRWLTDQEESVILNTAKAWSLTNIHAALVVLLDTGIRCGELCKCQKTDVFSDRIVLVDTKNGKTHAVPLTKRAQEALTTLQNSSGDTLVFPAGYEVLKNAFHRITAHCNLNDVTLHTLRHTFASRLVQRGVPLQTVSGLLNHSSLTMTMRYAHLAPLNYTNAIAVLENVE